MGEEYGKEGRRYSYHWEKGRIKGAGGRRLLITDFLPKDYICAGIKTVMARRKNILRLLTTTCCCSHTVCWYLTLNFIIKLSLIRKQ
jgi:hypothetical protein